MSQTFQEIESKYNIKFNSPSINSDIVKLFNTGNIDSNLIENGDYLNTIGLYFRYVKKDYVEAEKYYLMALNKHNADVMCNLGTLYWELKRYNEAEKYYLMEENKYNANAMCYLGSLYLELKRYDEAEKYYLIAIELNQNDARYYLASFYSEVKHNYKEMFHYYLLAAKHNSTKYYLSMFQYVRAMPEFADIDNIFELLI